MQGVRERPFENEKTSRQHHGNRSLCRMLRSLYGTTRLDRISMQQEDQQVTRATSALDACPFTINNRVRQYTYHDEC
jgi:hypothetical protein